ncbi:hypothetical protein MRX96_058558 [Rhipicephalus microplus]
MATVTVTISGPLLATLVYEHSNSPGDQETNLKICSIISCDLFEFYDKKCHLIADKLSALLRDKQKEVVGWYRFRRNTSLQTSLREQVLHQRLVRKLGQGYGNYFLLALFRSCTSSNDATHSNGACFLALYRPGFQTLFCSSTTHSEP